MPGSPDIYPSPYIVASDHGYTKHIYAGTDRVCTKIGNGGIDSLIQVSDSIQDNANLLFNMQLNDISSRIIVAAPASCNKKIDGTTNSNLTTNQPEVLHTGVKPEFLYTDFHNTMDELVQCNNSEETARYFYHPDHLGSASWITDASGHPVQHMQYLPYGETLIDQRTASYSERYTFTGKERDSETGYYYFGARYYSSDYSIWLSVDPMADKYPSLTPYNYCAWNPMKLVDPDGKDIKMSKTSQAYHNKYYNKKGYEKYTSLYNKLQNDRSVLFFVKDQNDNAYAKSHGADAGMLYENDESMDDYKNGVFYIEWGDPSDAFGGDASHVLLEEMYHAGQLIDNKYDNTPTLDKEITAKEFAIDINPNIKDAYTDENGNSGLPTQLGVISRGDRIYSRNFLKHGEKGYPCVDIRGNPGYAIIKPSYPDLE